MPCQSAPKPLAQTAENSQTTPRAPSAVAPAALSGQEAPHPRASVKNSVKNSARNHSEKPEATEQDWKSFLAHCVACEWEPMEKLLTERRWHTPSQKRWLPAYAWRHARSELAQGERNRKHAAATEAGQEWWGVPLVQSKDARWSMPESLVAAWLASPGWKENIAFCYVDEPIEPRAADALRLSALATGGLSSPEKAEITKQMALHCAQYWNKEVAQMITELGGAVHFDDAFRATLTDTWVGTPDASAIVEDRRQKLSPSARFAEASEQLRAFEGFGWFDPSQCAQRVILSAGITFDKDGNARLFNEHGAAVAMALIVSQGEKITEAPEWENAVGSLAVRAKHNAHSCWGQTHGLAVALTERAALAKVARPAKRNPAMGAQSPNDSQADLPPGSSTASPAALANTAEAGSAEAPARKAASRL